MITLEAADLIEGDASAANVVDYTINGAQIDSSRNTDVKALADGQLAGSKGTLYTTPGSTTAMVKSIILVNTDSSTRTVNLYVQRDGSNSRRIIPEDLSLEANGGSVVVSDAIYVYSASGELLHAIAAHASKHITGGSDEVDGDKLDIDWNPSNYTPSTTPSEADNVNNLTAHLYGIDQELGQKLENIVEDTSPQLGGDLDCQNNKFTNMLGFLMKSSTELTISSGAVTATQMFHTIDTEADAAIDDLDTINGGSTVNMIVIRAENDARTVVVKHNTGNIWLQGKVDISLDDLEDGLLLVWDGTKWFDIAAGGGGGGGSSTYVGLTDTPANFTGAAGKSARVNSGATALEHSFPTKLQDADGDTKVDVEESADEDIVRMDVAGNEAFLLSDAGILTLAKQSEAIIEMSADQTLTTFVWTVIHFNSEVVDKQGEWNSTTYRFTVTEAGQYLIATNLCFDTNATSYRQGLVYKNEAATKLHNTVPAVDGAFSLVFIAGILDLSANDYLEIKGKQGSGGDLDVKLNYSLLSIVKIT